MKNFLSLIVSVLMTLSLSACDLYEPGNLTHEKIQVTEEDTSVNVPLADVNTAYLQNLAEEYERNGNGPMQVSVTYNPSTSKNATFSAQKELNRIVQALHRKGITNVSGSLLPIHGQEDGANLVVTYSGYQVRPPHNCKLIEGVDSRNITMDTDYRLGCTRDTLLARQMANPKDMAKEAALDAPADGRRAGNVVEVYRTGAPNKKLEGESASSSSN